MNLPVGDNDIPVNLVEMTHTEAAILKLTQPYLSNATIAFDNSLLLRKP